ncbi:response regulator [Flavobacterium gawalongense]|uniref:Response regulator n=1 Tax=Flavobacterium gawalongense TaxID=2594432 RepID=A0A553BV18_9FLAO|nr:response regulator [Flavobacterium gawalongense]TRX02805.1 response regulator [Flavobacterium gawalongense]TRX08113.1 response regulator [Flavobacterium gawalongense]TRX11391.1 response regulator [Flavobacterium gawalongense]TRX12097.1 response regulator [Flavobacterium gawalongense]TRX29026.1 response regulator [Flavobacterium gawalongense]
MLDQILCVDDDPITLMLCKKVIIKASFSNEIITSQNGEEALDYFNKLKHTNSESELKKHPQLIFLDLNMPVMGGWEFLDIFNTDDYSEFNTIKVVVLSSTIDPEDLEKARSYPMVIDFLSKPITTSMLEYLKNKI